MKIKYDFRIDSDILEKAKKKAKKEGLTLSAWIRQLIIKNL